MNTTDLISSWINLSKIAPNAHSDKKQAGEYETPVFTTSINDIYSTVF